MDIEFRKITEFPRGTLATFLKDAYFFEPKFERDWHKQRQEFDDFFYDNPHIAEFCGFMTVLEGKPIGFLSRNPTNLPESTEVGHNCDQEMQGGIISGSGRSGVYWKKGDKKANFMDILSGTGLIKAAKYTLLSFTIEANYCETCKKVIFETDISK